MKKIEKIQSRIKEINEKTNLKLVVECVVHNDKEMYDVYNDSIEKNGAYTFKNLREVEVFIGGYVTAYCNINGLSCFTYEKLNQR